MPRHVKENPWLAALVSWALATVLITLAYGVWTWYSKEPFHWDMVRDAALFAAPLALFRAWRDRSRR